MSLFASLGQGDIWSISSISFASPLNDILEKEKFTLEDLLVEDELLQEIKSRNSKLINFLCQDEVIEKLIGYIIHPIGSEDDNIKVFRYPYMCCEIICCELPEMCLKLTDFSKTKYLDDVFSILSSNDRLDNYLTGYFEKILEMMLRSFTTSTLDYINMGGLNLFKRFVGHVNNYSIMQIIQRLLLPHIPFSPPQPDNLKIESDEFYLPKCNWSHLSMTCEILCNELITNKNKKNVSIHVADLLITVLQLSPLDSIFISSLCSSSCLNILIHAALESCIEEGNYLDGFDDASASAISVLESLTARLSENINSIEFYETYEINSSHSKESVGNNLFNLKSVLKNNLPSIIKLISYNIGRISKNSSLFKAQDNLFYLKLGFRQLQLIKFIESIVRLGDKDIDEILAKNKAIIIIIDEFFKCKLNSLLHLSVQRTICLILEGGSARRSLQKHLFDEVLLIKRLCSFFQEILPSEDQGNPLHSPITGHVIIIIQTISSVIEKSPKDISFDSHITSLSDTNDLISEKSNSENNQLLHIFNDLNIFETWKELFENTYQRYLSHPNSTKLPNTPDFEISSDNKNDLDFDVNHNNKKDNLSMDELFIVNSENIDFVPQDLDLFANFNIATISNQDDKSPNEIETSTKISSTEIDPFLPFDLSLLS